MRTLTALAAPAAWPDGRADGTPCGQRRLLLSGAVAATRHARVLSGAPLGHLLATWTVAPADGIPVRRRLGVPADDYSAHLVLACRDTRHPSCHGDTSHAGRQRADSDLPLGRRAVPRPTPRPANRTLSRSVPVVAGTSTQGLMDVGGETASVLVVRHVAGCRPHCCRRRAS